jgi:serine phosphatase RsbU (regulator of sigma subunit)
VGTFIGEELNQFTNHELNLKPGDVLYVFSDGYYDQFGGPNNKKFMSKRFRELLTEIHSLSMSKQKQALSEHMKDWMGENQQVDDILVIGIRI